MWLPRRASGFARNQSLFAICANGLCVSNLGNFHGPIRTPRESSTSAAAAAAAAAMIALQPLEHQSDNIA